jgi:hypothetical protein
MAIFAAHNFMRGSQTTILHDFIRCPSFVKAASVPILSCNSMFLHFRLKCTTLSEKETSVLLSFPDADCIIFKCPPF